MGISRFRSRSCGHTDFSVESHGNSLIDNTIQPLDFKITKFMVIELVVAILICVFFVGLGASAQRRRDCRAAASATCSKRCCFTSATSVARPCIGHHDADRFVPFLWTIFFFILGCNLFGMIPWMGSPTGSLAVTATLALITFLVVIGSGMKKMGPVGFWKAQVPHMDVPRAAQDLSGADDLRDRSLWPAW